MNLPCLTSLLSGDKSDSHYSSSTYMYENMQSCPIFMNVLENDINF